MNEIIKKIFGEAIEVKDYTYPIGTPNYIRYGYRARRLVWDKKECLLITPMSDGWNLPSLKKQAKKIEKLCSMNLVLELNRLSAMQRTNLIQSGIAFVVGSGQLFIPFWGSYFEEKIKKAMNAPSKMTAKAQLVFLYLYYLNRDEKVQINLTQVCKNLYLSKATCTRAVQLLETLGLIILEKKGTAKSIVFADDMDKILQRSMPYMVSPTRRQIYVKEIPKKLPGRISGIKALAGKSMLMENEKDGGYAIDCALTRSIPEDIIIDKQEFYDFGGAVIEAWNYNPVLLSDGEYVDEISLILLLRENTDERIQGELNGIRRKYGI